MTERKYKIRELRVGHYPEEPKVQVFLIQISGPENPAKNRTDGYGDVRLALTTEEAGQLTTNSVFTITLDAQ